MPRGQQTGRSRQNVQEETPAERNARLQAQFNVAQAASTTVQEDTPYYSATSYMDPNVPDVTEPALPQTSIFGEPIDLSPGAQIGLSFADVPLNQTYQDERQYNLSRFDATQEQPYYDFTQQGSSQGGAPLQTPSSWTEEELAMLGGMDVQAAINWGANYTGQALFGGLNVVTGEFFTGAFDMTTGELVNPDLLPSLLSPEFAHAMGISEEQRMMMGYNPEYPYELQDIPAGSGSGVGDGGYSGGGYSPSSGYSPTSGYGYGGGFGLTNWRIG